MIFEISNYKELIFYLNSQPHSHFLRITKGQVMLCQFRADKNMTGPRQRLIRLMQNLEMLPLDKRLSWIHLYNKK